MDNTGVETEELVNTIKIHHAVDIVKCEDDCFLVSSVKNEIYKYKQSGECIEKIKLPHGVKVNRMCIMKNGNIVFSDLDNKCIKICNMNGDVIKSIGEGLLKRPVGIHTDEASSVVYVADWNSGYVFVFDIGNGEIVRKIGSPGKKVGQLKGVHDVALTKQGHILVSECGNHRLQLFDKEGRFIKVLIRRGNQSGKVMYPRGIVLDEEDNIIVSCRQNIQLFNSDGNFIKRIDRQDGISHAMGLCIISHHPRKVAVANYAKDNVIIFNY